MKLETKHGESKRNKNGPNESLEFADANDPYHKYETARDYRPGTGNNPKRSVKKGDGTGGSGADHMRSSNDSTQTFANHKN